VLRFAAHLSSRKKMRRAHLIAAAAVWLFTRPQVWWKSVPAWRFFLEITGGVFALSGITGVVALALDIENREEDRINRAWTLIAAAKADSTGNIGLRDALETLNSRRISLGRIQVPGADLQGVNLSNSRLEVADLSETNLAEANLHGSYLDNANLTGAGLAGADLSDADLTEADLRGANLLAANLKGADLTMTRLNGAELTDANLRSARTVGGRIADEGHFCRTKMPDHTLCNRDCGYGPSDCPYFVAPGKHRYSDDRTTKHDN
jgi:hypothetical protein